MSFEIRSDSEQKPRRRVQRHHLIIVALLAVLGIALLFALLVLTAPPAIAPSAPDAQSLDEATMRVAKNLYCPVCPGVPLDVCETQACIQWRAQIRQKLAEGQTPEQIAQYFEAQYGQRVLGAPRAQGINLVVYAVPALAVVAGAALLYLTVRRWTSSRAASIPTGAPNEYRERVERELRELE